MDEGIATRRKREFEQAESVGPQSNTPRCTAFRGTLFGSNLKPTKDKYDSVLFFETRRSRPFDFERLSSDLSTTGRVTEED